MSDSSCMWSVNGAGMAPLADLIRNDPTCPFPPTLRSFIIPMGIVDQFGHELDGDWDPKGRGGCDHRDTAEWKAAHTRRPSMSDTAVPPAEPTVANVAAQSVVPTGATVEVDAAIGQVKSLVPEGTGPGLLIAGAAVLAVVGAAIKLGPQALRNRAEEAGRLHEREMRRLELEEKKSQNDDEQHKKCSAERAALETKVSQLEGAVSSISTKMSEAGDRDSGIGDFDFEDVEVRLTKLEKAVKASQAKGKK